MRLPSTILTSLAGLGNASIYSFSVSALEASKNLTTSTNAAPSGYCSQNRLNAFSASSGEFDEDTQRLPGRKQVLITPHWGGRAISCLVSCVSATTATLPLCNRATISVIEADQYNSSGRLDRRILPSRCH